MYTRITLLATTILLCFQLKAQSVHYGITADVNVNMMNGYGLSSKSLVGYNGGAFATVDINKKWSLQPEVLYTIKNLKKADDFMTYYVNSGNSFANTDFSLHYISIPVLVNYHLSKLLTVNAGPEYSFLVYDNEDLLYSGKDAFKNTEFGVDAGLQLAFSPDFSLFGSYYYGLSNINDIDSRYKWHSRQARIGINCRIF
jgi:hypothetical protein